MRILQVLPSFAPEWGGPPKVVYQIAESLRHTFEIDILTTSSPGDDLVKIPPGVRFINLKRSVFHHLWKSHSAALLDFMNQNIANYDLLHIHELWLSHLFTSSRAASAHNVPFIISPHGELDAWALNYKGFKKRIFTEVFQRNLFLKATAIHALTQKEADEISRYCNGNPPPVFIIPNALPHSVIHYENNDALLPSKDEPYLLFLSRINIKKGCDILLRAFSEWQHNTKYKLVITGTGDPSYYLDTLKKLAVRLGIDHRVVFTGAVYGSRKKALYENASLFVLPSLAEGLPLVLLEAMQAGCPMLISNNCGIDQILKEEKLAEVCEATVDSVLAGLDKFLQLSPEEIISIRCNGPRVLRKYFSNEIVSEKYINMYEEVLASNLKQVV
jgi:glycosyltransferase involved in cell wall biosynthesis